MFFAAVVGNKIIIFRADAIDWVPHNSSEFRLWLHRVDQAGQGLGNALIIITIACAMCTGRL